MSHRSIDPSAVGRRGRYRLLTSLVVPRPIGWLSTRSAEGVANLAPFSYFAALSDTPMLVGVSVGQRAGRPKDSLVNIRERGAFCVNVVDEEHLESMNATSADLAPEIDEFQAVGLEATESDRVDAPYLWSAPAVLECRLDREVELGGAGNTLLIGEVVGIRVRDGLPTLDEEGWRIDPRALRPVGRLGGSGYLVQGTVHSLPRPGR